MANEVYANGRELSCKSASGKSIASFPDVCFTPPQAPPTPLGVPVPYPNTGMSKDTTRGSRTVRITRKEVMLKNKSHFKKSYGDEAGRAPKKGIITSTNTGKVYFTSWSMDVKIEGLNVVRHLDLTTHNHNPSPGNTATWPHTSKMKAAFKPGGKCAGMEHLRLQPYSKACPSTAGGGAQTGHHLIPGRCMRGKAGYSHSKAPVICVSRGNQHQGSHKRCHAKFDPVELDHFDKGKPFKYETARNTAAASAGGSVEPAARADEKRKGVRRLPARPVLQGQAQEGAGLHHRHEPPRLGRGGKSHTTRAFRAGTCGTSIGTEPWQRARPPSISPTSLRSGLKRRCSPGTSTWRARNPA
ncbi:DUF4150 domain-containing protein [Pseudomonas aeruginosa]|nr:DUF4150 domain-containing protein [Pseudomonas aeruginosa]QYE88586.1 DUF4150 domain-containing protein [Pseudomonas aeruginosa]QYE92011.1 DUF4150 domain-containing protein [Pseudomonas aeruginosa]HCW0489455.1 DUF4150 domain-containing protein [Pseudomonas aeruginosa]